MRGSLIIKQNVATGCKMRWKRFSETPQPDKLFRPWLLPFSPDNGARSWFKRAPALISNAKHFYVLVRLSLQTAHPLLKAASFISGLQLTFRRVLSTFRTSSGGLGPWSTLTEGWSSVTRATMAPDQTSVADPWWELRLYLLPLKPAGVRRAKMTTPLWSSDRRRCWCRNAGQCADPADSTIASQLPR